MFDDLGNVMGGAGDALDKIEGAVGDNTIGGTGNTVLDPAPDIRKTLSDLFVAIVQIFSFLSNLFKI